MYDSHVHSQYSMDSTADMEDSVRKAIEENMKSICFTDHVDFDSTMDKIDFVFRTSDYFRELNRLKYRYRDEIQVLAGVEIGMQTHLLERYDRFVGDNPFDFVIMSIHSVGGEDIYLDNYTKDKDPLEACLEYYRTMLDCVKAYSNFDVLGHIDFIDRYFQSKDQIPAFEEYKDILVEIFQVLIHKGKGIELNTSGYRKDIGVFHPKTPILELYKEMGGEIITMGSDAHRPEDVGADFKLGEKLLGELGFKYIYVYKERKKFPINIA